MNDFTSIYYVKSSECKCTAKAGTSAKCTSCNGVMDKMRECGQKFVSESSEELEQEFVFYYSDSMVSYCLCFTKNQT